MFDIRYNERWAATTEHGKLIGHWNDLAAFYQDTTGHLWAYSGCSYKWQAISDFRNRRGWYLNGKEIG